MASFSVDIEAQDGTKYGSGPISSAVSVRRVRRLSRAGVLAVVAPATDERMSIVQVRRYMHCYTQLGTGIEDAGYGIIDQIDIDTESRILSASGDDLLAELTLRSTSFLELKFGDQPISLDAALALVIAIYNVQGAPVWTLDYTTYASTCDTTSGSDVLTNVTNIENFIGRIGGPMYGDGIFTNSTVVSIDVGASEITISSNATTTDTGVLISPHTVFYKCAGESVLEVFVRIAEMTGTQFRLHPTIDRCIQWMYNIQPPSGIRAVIGVDPVAAETNAEICLIEKLTYIQDTADLISHIHPWGKGEGSGRVGMSSPLDPGSPGTTGANDPLKSTRTAPDGYTLDLDNNVLRRDDAQTDYGYSIIHKTFSDISATLDVLDPSYDPALVSARNQLFDAAYEYLRSHSYPLLSYKISVSKLDAEVRPGETIHVIYRAFAGQQNEHTGAVTNYQWIDVDADLLVLESTTDIDSNGIRTPALVVSSVSRWPMNDRNLLATLLRDAQHGQAHQ